MNDFTLRGIVGLILLLITFSLGSCVGATSVQDTWRLDAAKTDCAQFNPHNGRFEWLTNEEG